jgi:deferrochelatase/peroxidase EfeB
LDGLADVMQRELASDLDAPRADKTLPPPETGELGFRGGYDRAFLTITVGFSSTAFDVCDVPAADRPRDLRPMPWAALGDSPLRTQESGDVVLQICSDDLYVCEHVLRRIEEEHGDSLSTTWTQTGTQRYTSRPGRTSREEGRALVGFLDGTSNLNPRRSGDDAELVFVDPRPEVIAAYPPNPEAGTGSYGSLPSPPQFPTDLAPVPVDEPAWTRNGTYMTVRISTFDTRPWDRLPENDQEGSVGRFKFSGASLDLTDDPARLNEEPAFTADQSNTTVPLTAHVRKANPRRPEDASRRLFRRGYPIIAAGSQQLERGLAFISFARTTSTQFEFIFRAWLRNPDFPHQGAGADRLLFGTLPETVHCGGYYFVPATRTASRPWEWIVPWSQPGS